MSQAVALEEGAGTDGSPQLDTLPGRRAVRIASHERPSLLSPVLLLGFSAGVFLVLHAAPDMVAARDGSNDAGFGFAVLLASAIACLMPLLGRDHAERQGLMVVWLAKSLCVLTLMLLYEARYEQLDAYWYHQIANAEFPSQLRSVGTGLIAKVAWVIAWPLQGSYHALKLTFALIGLIGVLNLYRAAQLAVPTANAGTFMVIGLWPSLLFWSSTIGKEPITLLGLGLFAHGAMRLFRRRRWGSSLVIAGLLIAGGVRPWLMMVLVPPLIFLVRGRRVTFAAKTALALLGAGCLYLGWQYGADVAGLTAGVGLGEALEDQARHWDTGGGSAQQVSVDLRSLTGLALFFSKGCFTALFRPLPGEVSHAFGVVAGIESIVLLGMVCSALVAAYRRLDWRDPVLRWTAATTIAWAVLYAGISSFNLGAAVRFRMQVIPFVLAFAWVAHAKSLGSGVQRARRRE